MNAASMANGIVHNDKRIGKGDKLGKGQTMTVKRDIQRIWQSNE